ncbi:MAG: thymidylate synthase [Phycisphaerales bacterium JB052]
MSESKLSGINEVYVALVRKCCNGRYIEARGQGCYELPQTFAMELPPGVAGDITLRERGLNYMFGLIERMSYLSGVGHHPHVITSYMENYRNFLEENHTDMGAYGPRMSYQLNQAYHLLRKDPDTRQAVVNVYNYMQDGHGDKRNEPCTLALHFLLRDGALNMTAYMRSNDIWWGFPYDMAAFAFLQQVMAHWLGVELGTYTHVATSLHMYESMIPTIEKFLDAPADPSGGLALPEWDVPYDKTWDALDAFWALEELTRVHRACMISRDCVETKLAGSKFLEAALMAIADHWSQKRRA